MTLGMPGGMLGGIPGGIPGGMRSGMRSGMGDMAPKPGFGLLPISPAAGYLSSTSDKIYNVAEGRIHEIPIESVVKERSPFRLEEKQSTFILPFGKQTQVQYSAPGATRYTLFIIFDRYNLGTTNNSDVGFQKFESKTGEFNLQLSNKETVRELACKLAQTDGTEPDPKALKSLRDRFVPEIAKFTKTQLVGVPLPVTAAIVARRDNQTVCLVHQFLVDIPAGIFTTKPAKAK